MFSISDLNSNKVSKWPFSRMEIEEVVYYSFEEDAKRASDAQRLCHAYGKMYGFKFKTKSITKDGKKYMLIARIS